MRIDLNTTFAEKDAAKALGARWDAFKRVWYVVDPEDLSPFLRWIPSVCGYPQKTDRPASTAPAFSAAPTKQTPDSRAYGITGPAEVPHCGCNVLPWDDCEHTTFAFSSI